MLREDLNLRSLRDATRGRTVKKIDFLLGVRAIASLEELVFFLTSHDRYAHSSPDDHLLPFPSNIFALTDLRMILALL